MCLAYLRLHIFTYNPIKWNYSNQYKEKKNSTNTASENIYYYFGVRFVWLNVTKMHFKLNRNQWNGKRTNWRKMPRGKCTRSKIKLKIGCIYCVNTRFLSIVTIAPSYAILEFNVKPICLFKYSFNPVPNFFFFFSSLLFWKSAFIFVLKLKTQTKNKCSMHFYIQVVIVFIQFFFCARLHVQCCWSIQTNNKFSLKQCFLFFLLFWLESM